MLKKTLVTLATAATLAAITVPAMASSNNVFGSDTEFGRNSAVLQLKRAGVNVHSVDQWNGLVRAFVLQDDGTLAQTFYTPGTLRPVAL